MQEPFEAKAVIRLYPSGDKFEFTIYRQDQVDSLIEILTILETSAKAEQQQAMESIK